MTDIEIVEDDVSDLDSPLPGLWVTPPVVLPPPPPPPPRPPIKQPTSPFQLPSNAMYGFLGEHAETLDGPLNWTYPALVTVYASTRILTPANVRPTLYTVLVGPPQDGKPTSQTAHCKVWGSLAVPISMKRPHRPTVAWNYSLPIPRQRRIRQEPPS